MKAPEEYQKESGKFLRKKKLKPSKNKEDQVERGCRAEGNKQMSSRRETSYGQ